VTIPAAIRSFWEAFQATVEFDALPRFYEAFHFDDNERSANELARLVILKCCSKSERPPIITYKTMDSGSICLPRPRIAGFQNELILLQGLTDFKTVKWRLSFLIIGTWQSPAFPGISDMVFRVVP
jgi:hypothetical protein